MKAFSDNSLSIGNTPLVRLARLAPDAEIYAKIESVTQPVQSNAA